jgi:hypothetical protein
VGVCTRYHERFSGQGIASRIRVQEAGTIVVLGQVPVGKICETNLHDGSTDVVLPSYLWLSKSPGHEELNHAIYRY